MKTRYIIAIAAAALIFSGCQKNELSDEWGAGVNDGWLNFRLSGLQLTKGTLINSEDEMLEVGVDTFRVQAWNADCSSFVTEQTVTYDTTESKWQTSSPIAWTGSDSKTFFAYTNLPASGATVTNSCTFAVQKQTLEYTLPLDARKQNDVMLGWYKGNGGGTHTADITFVHPLSSIVLKQGSMDVTGIKRITVSGLYASGTVDVTYAVVDNKVDTTYVWSTRTGSVVSTLTPAEGAQYISVGEDGIIGTPFIVIPQTVAANQVKITVTATVNGADKNLVVNVPAGEFEAGKSHVFTLGYLTPGALPGEFSVSATKKVHFSCGNVWADASLTPAAWHFENNQYDHRTRSGLQAVIDGISTNTPSNHWGTIRYSTTGGNDYGLTDWISDNSHYSGDFRDWGTAFDNRGTWRTLSGGDGGEWEYILEVRTTEVTGVTSETPARYFFGSVNLAGGGTVNGLYIFPDVFIWPSGITAPQNINAVSAFSTNSYSIADFEKLEKAGIVFLPAAGYAYGASPIHSYGERLDYWSSTVSETDKAYEVQASLLGMDAKWANDRFSGFSVRLVTQAGSVASGPF